MKLERSIFITFSKVGFHNYPNAPEEVEYLKARHRHVFKFRVSVSVTHDDREIEFHMLKSWVEGLYAEELEANHKSCEMLAEDLVQRILQHYPHRDISVEVSEDGENGAVVQYRCPHKTKTAT